MTEKPFYLSKTLWVQILSVLSLLFPAVQAWVSSNPVESGAMFAAVNTVIRFVTHGRISAFSVPTVPPSVTNLFMVGAMCIGTAAVMVLSSCSSAGSYPALGSVSGSVSYRHAESGAKAGLIFDGSKMSPFARVPFFDESGNLVGMIEVRDALTPSAAK